MCVNLSHKSPITHSHTSNQQMLPYNRKKRKKKKTLTAHYTDSFTFLSFSRAC